MDIAVIGMGLIGGSFCKAIKAKTKGRVLGFDISEDTCKEALESNSIDEVITENELNRADLTIVCLHPVQTVKFLKENASKFKKGSIVIDSCGIKGYVLDSVSQILFENGVRFIGAHPMAGREFSGFSYSLADLFSGASFIIVPNEYTDFNTVELLKDFAKTLGFSKTVVTTAQKHDETIAFTSQLAHIVSNAYVKSPTIENESGFSAGSFMDLTRVAKLNENMWSELFINNKEPLLKELINITEKLNEYIEALKSDDEERLRSLLKDGRIIKEKSLINHADRKKPD